jgi:predicted SAM-dependent methyltransferase
MYRHQRTKDLYFLVVKQVNKAILPIYRLKYKNTLSRDIHLNLGCGASYLDGFINVDGNIFRKIDLWLDMRNRFPFPSDCICSIYCCHVFEHFYPDELQQVIRECYRVLRPRGGIRIAVPDLKLAVEKYLEGDYGWFIRNPRNYSSLGGKLSNLLLSDGSHKLVFDYSHLKECLEREGFVEVRQAEAGKSLILSNDVIARIKETDKDHAKYSLYVEARKII